MSPPDDQPTALDRLMRYADRGASLWLVLLVLGVFGLGLGIRMGVWVLSQPWDLDASSPVVTSNSGDCGSLTGGRYEIEVDGSRYSCGGAEEKCGWDEAVVAYDPEDPSRCRVAARVDSLGAYERFGVLISLAFIFNGVAGGAYRWSEKLRMADMVEDEPRWGERRRRLRGVAWGGLILGVIVTVSAALSWLVASG